MATRSYRTSSPPTTTSLRTRAGNVLGAYAKNVAGQDDEVGELADGQGAAVGLQEVGVRGAHRVAVDRGLHVEGLGGLPGVAAGERAAGQGRVDAGHRVHLGDVPVAGQGEHGTRLVQAPHRPGLVPALGADVLGPVLAGPRDLGGAVARLHTGDDTEFGEARRVGGVQALDVDDLVAGVARTVEGAGVLDGVQDGADTAVAGGVHEALEAAGVQLGEQFRELVRGIERVAPVPPAPGIGLEERGRARLDHIVDVQLERADPQPVVGEVPRGRSEVVQVRVGRPARMEERGDDPRTQPPSARARLNNARSSREFCGSTTVVMPYPIASSRLLARRPYCRSGEAHGTPSSFSARWPSRESPFTAKSLMKPVGSPVSGSVSARPNGSDVRSRSTPRRRSAAELSQAVCTS